MLEDYDYESLSLTPTSAFQHGQSVTLCKTCLLRYGERIPLWRL